MVTKISRLLTLRPHQLDSTSVVLSSTSIFNQSFLRICQPSFASSLNIHSFFSSSSMPIQRSNFPASKFNGKVGQKYFSNSSNATVPTKIPRPFYLDYQSTTPMDPRVIDKMMPLLLDVFGNPHSRSHSLGWEAEDLVEEARAEVAKLINCEPKNIVFTSGATESNNMAIKGIAGFYGERARNRASAANAKLKTGGKRSGASSANGIVDAPSVKNHAITTQIEHKCVLQSFRTLQDKGWDVTYLPVDNEGLIRIEDLENAIIPGRTLLCSVMFVNNEIGVVQDIKKIGEICRKNKVFFHTDAAQGVGKLPINVDDLNVDLMSISAHKLYGPKGVGALYIRSKPRVRLLPIIDGGGQERGFRSGTLPASLIVGFGESCKVCKEEMENDAAHITRLYKRLKSGIMDKLPLVTLNGSPEKRYFGNLNLSFAFVEGESLMMSLKQFAVSSGSACTSASLEPSYVLRALGVDEALAHTSLRFGIGRFTTDDEVEHCISELCAEVERLRELSPLYEFAIEEKETGEKTSFVWT